MLFIMSNASFILHNSIKVATTHTALLFGANAAAPRFCIPCYSHQNARAIITRMTQSSSFSMIFSPCFEHVCIRCFKKFPKFNQVITYTYFGYIRFRLDLELHDMITKRVGKLYIIFIFFIENEGLYSC